MEFRALCSARIKSLQNLSEASVASILSYARDFRKICPLQAPGVEGGYSEAEINAIDDMVEGQCREILEISTSWQAEVTKFKEEQVQSSKCYDEFIDKYEKVTQDLAMSEGLGQKYGAPRRRAQEQIRTELSRDEQKAGKIDELLATLEFVCAEFKRNDGTASDERTVATKLTSPSNPEDSTSEEANFDLLCESLKTANQAWELMCSVRRMLLQRVSYLKVADKMELLHLPWLNKTRISELLQSKNTETEEDDEIIESYDGRTLQEVIESIDSKCRLETRELYKTEGKLDMLSDGSVPLSLQQWLSESQEKVVGRGGYREKAWKKLWLQVERSEILFQRHQNLEHVEVVPRKIGFPALCLRSISEAFLVHAKLDQIERESSFRKLMNIWQKGREKHERLLRPRLGSPDVVEELNDLNNVELQRSSELVENVTKFRTLLIRTQVKLLKRFYEDLGTCSKGLVLMLDTTYRQEQIQIPPDTDIPKKHMTLKKLRKAQRIKEEVALGMSDRSKQRTWPAINMQRTLEVVRAVEDLVSDLGSLDEDTPPKNDSNTDKKSKTKAVKAATDENDSETASLLLSAWMNNLRELSEVNSLVSSAHRIIITERDEAVDRYVTCIDSLFKHLREKYDAVLKQERSWNERWRRQVQMLRDGNL